MEYKFDSKVEFMDKLRELFESGIPRKKMKIVLPNPDHDVEHLIEEYAPPSKLKYFTLAGGIAGCLTGFGFTIFTVLDWPLVTGGKPIVSWPPFVVIAFELTILFGAVISFAGLHILARLPRFSRMLNPQEYGNQFVIIIDED